jgi:hypothetical protein
VKLVCDRGAYGLRHAIVTFLFPQVPMYRYTESLEDSFPDIASERTALYWTTDMIQSRHGVSVSEVQFNLV